MGPASPVLKSELAPPCLCSRKAAVYCLPICGLPRQNKRCGKDGVRSVLREGPDGFLETLQGNTPMLVSHVSDQWTIGQVRNVHGREGQQRMQDIVMGSTNLDDSRKLVSAQSKPLLTCQVLILRRDLPSPQSEAIGINFHHLIADRGNMVDQAQLVCAEILRGRSRVNVKVREREKTSSLPLLDYKLDLGRPHKIRFVRRSRPVLSDRNVIIWTTDLVLGAIAALGKTFVTANVAALAV